MKITDITLAKRNKNRSNLYIDGEFFASVDNFTAVKHGLKKDLEIDEDSLSALIFESEKEKALSYAFGYLSKYQKTEKQLEQKLVEKGYIEGIVRYVLDKTKEYKFVDDEVFASQYLEQNSSRKGARLLKYELKAKGVSDKILDEIGPSEEDEERAVIALSEKFFAKNEDTRENTQKLFKRLMSKGFSFDAIKSGMAKVKSDIDFEE